MDLSELASQSASRWGLPIVLSGAVYGAFVLLENNASKEAKAAITNFLILGRYDEYLGSLPSIIERAFINIFGDKQLSKKCIVRSFFLSILSLIIVTIFSLIYNYHDATAVFSFIPNAIDVLKKKNDPKSMQLIALLEDLRGHKVWIIGITLWVMWSLIPDYLAVLKTRIIITLLKHTNPSNFTLFITAIVDFIVGSWVFLTSFALLQGSVIAASMYLGYIPLKGVVPTLGSSFTVALIFSGFIFTLETAILAPTGLLYFIIPIANIFWASMLPSLWLWTYIIFSLITRYLLAARPAVRKLIYFLDVTSNPIRSIGFVAASVLCFASYAVLGVLFLYENF